MNSLDKNSSFMSKITVTFHTQEYSLTKDWKENKNEAIKLLILKVHRVRRWCTIQNSCEDKADKNYSIKPVLCKLQLKYQRFRYIIFNAIESSIDNYVFGYQV